MQHVTPKYCTVCGRKMTWRKKWAKNWDTIKYCSKACRRQKLQPIDHALEATILRLLGQRANNGSICPSEAVRVLEASGLIDNWRAYMEPARQAARRLVVKKQLEIIQKGRVVDPSTARGPIRLRRSARASS
ncbi:MAG: DUF2256 and DUF3253 domain-containing protein [Bacteroidota bacterium]